MTHEELVNVIQAAINQLADDENVPKRQILRELKDIRSHIGSAIDTLDHVVSGDRTMAERDEL
jgi:Mg2+ and Co2+ transporter CorA